MADNQRYKVVINHEEQYSLWPADRAIAPGWKETGTVGDKEACLRHIEEVWTDNRPRNLRHEIEADLRRR